MFVNERISKDSIVDFDLKRVAALVPLGVWHPSSFWTIDYDTRCYLQNVWDQASGREPAPIGDGVRKKYHFGYQGCVYLVDLTDSNVGHKSWTDEQRKYHRHDYYIVWSIELIVGANDLSCDSDFKKMLYSAFQAMRGEAAFNSHINEYQLKLSVDGEVIDHV